MTVELDSEDKQLFAEIEKVAGHNFAKLAEAIYASGRAEEIDGMAKEAAWLRKLRLRN